MEESTCHEIVIYLSQRFSSYVLFFFGGGGGTFSLVLNTMYDFYVVAERMIV